MGIDPATHQPLANSKAAASSQSTVTDESAKTSNTRKELSLKNDGSRREAPLSTDSSEQSSWPESGSCSNVCDQGPELLENWLSETGLSMDEPWLDFTSRNDELGNVEGTLPWDGTTDWLLDYQDFGMCSSNSSIGTYSYFKTKGIIDEKKKDDDDEESEAKNRRVRSSTAKDSDSD
uniref:Uncharacterized protein n=1 Tax=Zea mays TaxID=4577 RepID=A0A804MW33_MAIZE